MLPGHSSGNENLNSMVIRKINFMSNKELFWLVLQHVSSFLVVVSGATCFVKCVLSGTVRFTLVLSCSTPPPASYSSSRGGAHHLHLLRRSKNKGKAVEHKDVEMFYK